jgi:uncharacterized protein (DUF2141 family)
MSKKVCLCWLVGTFIAVSGAASAATVTVSVKNIANAKGMVRGALCDRQNFMKECSVKGEVQPKDSTAELTFTNVLPGQYAVTIYHDENNNKVLDRNFIGIPLEGYGFSRDAKGKRGPPSFDDAVFEAKEGSTTIVINLNQ